MKTIFNNLKWKFNPFCSRVKPHAIILVVLKKLSYDNQILPATCPVICPWEKV